MVDIGSISSNMKLGLYGGIIVFIGGILGAIGWWASPGHILMGIIIAVIPFLPQFFTNLESVHERKHQVKDNQIRMIMFNHFQSNQTIVSDIYIESFRFKFIF